jgi:GNAT superfamily N-acetyltransferase
MASFVAFQRESVATLWPELLPLADEHWREVRWDPSTEADLDTERYEQADELGLYRMFTLRDRGALIGYAGFWIAPHAMQRGSLQAVADCIYIRPDRRHGLLARNLIARCERALRDLGAQVAHHHVRPARDYGPVLVRLGYAPIETTYAKRLHS